MKTVSIIAVCCVIGIALGAGCEHLVFGGPSPHGPPSSQPPDFNWFRALAGGAFCSAIVFKVVQRAGYFLGLRDDD
jgi:hypothetical protein